MKGSKWPLVVFTVLVQLAVGLFLVSGVLHFSLMSRYEGIPVSSYSASAVLGVVAILAVSMLISLFHLGSPRNAARAILNLGSSWLSAEIVFVLLFLFMAAGYLVLLWLGREMNVPAKIGFGIGSGVGLILVYCMTRVYRLRSVPVWNSPATLVSFYRTTFLLGIVTAGGLLLVIHLATSEKMGLIVELQHLRTIFPWMIVAASFLVGLDLMMIIARSIAKARDDKRLETGSIRVFTPYGTGKSLRIVCSLTGLISFGLSLFWAYRLPPDRWLASLMVGVAVVFMLISELIDRRLFYSSYRRSGF